jgi:cytochrome c oxidase assembly protein subunit 11
MQNNQELARRNVRIVIIGVAFVFGMLALSFAAVPLYRLFCQITGLGGTTQTAAVAPAEVPTNSRDITVRFNSGVDDRLPWDFRPEQQIITLKIGQVGMTNYVAKNISVQPNAGVAVYNVTPPKAGKYFTKTQCFCFNDQSLMPQQQVDMPVVFFVDPKMLADPNMQDVQEITLSYRFYPAGSDALAKAQAEYINQP